MQFSTVWQNFTAYIKDIFNIHDDTDWKGASDDIKAGVPYRGANLWTLIFAMLICSVGLNVNSTAVVIGAMLISPLMGPILGIGLALGSNDIGLFRMAMRNLAIAVVISIIASAIYFWLTPLQEAQSELFARTRPTIFDVLIATFGGFIGIIVSTREGYSNAIPGVAIATALMPPLCTAGYGLASGQWDFFAGAMYLFFINSIFISITTMIVVRYLKFPKKSYIDEKTEKNARMAIVALVLVTMIPSIYVAISVIQEAVFTQQAKAYMDEVFADDNIAVVKYSPVFNKDTSYIEVTLMGEYLTQDRQADLQDKMKHFGLANNTQLKIRQFNDKNDVADLNKNLRSQILEDLFIRNDTLIENKNQTIRKLEDKILELSKSKDKPIYQVFKELNIEYPEVTEFGYDVVIKANTSGSDTIPMAILKTKKRLSKTREKKLARYLRTRLNLDTIQLVVY